MSSYYFSLSAYIQISQGALKLCVCVHIENFSFGCREVKCNKIVKLWISAALITTFIFIISVE